MKQTLEEMKLEDEEIPFEKIVNRMFLQFPMDRVDWNSHVAPYLREMQALLAQARTEALGEAITEIMKTDFQLDTNVGRYRFVEHLRALSTPPKEEMVEIEEHWHGDKLVKVTANGIPIPPKEKE